MPDRTGTCSLESCDRKWYAREWCQKHHRAWRKHGDPLADMTREPCAVDGCDRPREGREWCMKHYHQWRRGALPDAPPPIEQRCKYDGCDRFLASRGWCSYHYGRWQTTGDPAPPVEFVPDPCAVPDCERLASSLGLCATHYSRQARSFPLGGPLKRRDNPTCNTDGCTKPRRARGMCQGHWRQWRSSLTGPIPRRTQMERFWSFVDENGPIPAHRPDLGPCWVWTGTLGKGYGKFGPGHGQRGMVDAYRWLYKKLIGDPKHLSLDHLCRNTACVRPDHLDPCPLRVNILRGESPAAQNARKTHCKRGHPFDLANTYRNRKGQRQCRACARNRMRGRARSRVRH